jgi:hypothetical protein
MLPVRGPGAAPASLSGILFEGFGLGETPTVGDGFLLKIWRSGPDACKPKKLPLPAEGLVERGLMRIDTQQPCCDCFSPGRCWRGTFAKRISCPKSGDAYSMSTSPHEGRGDAAGASPSLQPPLPATVLSIAKKRKLPHQAAGRTYGWISRWC